MKMDEMIFQELCRRTGPDQVKKQEPMKKHTTFRIGGPADFFVTPRNPEAVRAVLKFCREEELPVFVMGNGSNLLVADSGFRGVVIQLDHNFQKISVTGTESTHRQEHCSLKLPQRRNGTRLQVWSLRPEYRVP